MCACERRSEEVRALACVARRKTHTEMESAHTPVLCRVRLRVVVVRLALNATRAKEQQRR